VQINIHTNTYIETNPVNIPWNTDRWSTGCTHYEVWPGYFRLQIKNVTTRAKLSRANQWRVSLLIVGFYTKLHCINVTVTTQEFILNFDILLTAHLNIFILILTNLMH